MTPKALEIYVADDQIVINWDGSKSTVEEARLYAESLIEVIDRDNLPADDPAALVLAKLCEVYGWTIETE